MESFRKSIFALRNKKKHGSETKKKKKTRVAHPEYLDDEESTDEEVRATLMSVHFPDLFNSLILPD